MVKLNERKVRWIVQQKLRGVGSGEIALIQRVSRRGWSRYGRLTSVTASFQP